jgi:hypothetical protein
MTRIVVFVDWLIYYYINYLPVNKVWHPRKCESSFLVSSEIQQQFFRDKNMTSPCNFYATKEVTDKNKMLKVFLKIYFEQILKLRKYRISRPIRRTFFPGKCDLNSTCVLCAEGERYFQTYKYPYIYYTTSLSWDSEDDFSGSDDDFLGFYGE